MSSAIACVPGASARTEGQDWRVYGLLAMLWSPVFDAWLSGNLTLPLALTISLVWRYREPTVSSPGC